MDSSNIVLISGAKGGLGTTVTRAFLDSGATVIGVSRSIRASDFDHPSFHALPAELNSRAAAETLVSAAVAQFGRIDSAIHLIGAFAGGSTVMDSDDATFEQMLDLNLRSLFHLARGVLPVMRRQGGGTLLAVGSRSAIEPQAGLGPYSASKAALVSLVQTMARENGNLGITANVVLPGTMDTPANRAAMPEADNSNWVRPEQVAALLVHLASPAARQVNGAVIPVYGGGF